LLQNLRNAAVSRTDLEKFQRGKEDMKKIWLAVATGILGMVFGSSLVWSQPNAWLQYHGAPVLEDIQYPDANLR
jgi:hypothetical protein